MTTCKLKNKKYKANVQKTNYAQKKLYVSLDKSRVVLGNGKDANNPNHFCGTIVYSTEPMNVGLYLENLPKSNYVLADPTICVELMNT